MYHAALKVLNLNTIKGADDKYMNQIWSFGVCIAMIHMCCNQTSLMNRGFCPACACEDVT